MHIDSYVKSKEICVDQFSSDPDQGSLINSTMVISFTIVKELVSSLTITVHQGFSMYYKKIGR